VTKFTTFYKRDRQNRKMDDITIAYTALAQYASHSETEELNLKNIDIH